MSVADGEVIRVSARQEMAGDQDHVSVFHYLCDFAAPQTEGDVMDAIAEDIDTAFSTLNAIITTGQDPLDMKFDVVEFVGGLLKITRNIGLIIWPDVLYNPTGAGDKLPPGVAALVKFLTGIGKVYGRKFIGGLIETAQDGGNLTSAALTALGLFGGAILSDPAIDVNNWFEPGVMSTREQDFVIFSEVDASGNIAYQRRRRKGTGS